MQLIPKALVCGLAMPTLPANPGMPDMPSRSTFNSIWNEVTATYSYQSLQFAPAGDGVQFLGQSLDDTVIIQPPLVQVRDSIGLSVEQSASKAQAITKIAGRYLKAPESYNLGIKIVWHSPATTGDAIGLLKSSLMKQDDGALQTLSAGGELRMGMKFQVMHAEDYFYSVSIEPLNQDPSFFFLEVDAQYAGVAALDLIATKAQEAEAYMKTAVGGFIDNSGL